MALGTSARIVSEQGILAAMSGDEMVLMDAMSGEYYTFEGTGADIWRMLETPITVGEVCSRLVAEFDGPEEDIRESTLAFLSGLLERKLIRLA